MAEVLMNWYSTPNLPGSPVPGVAVLPVID